VSELLLLYLATSQECGGINRSPDFTTYAAILQDYVESLDSGEEK